MSVRKKVFGGVGGDDGDSGSSGGIDDVPNVQPHPEASKTNEVDGGLR